MCVCVGDKLDVREGPSGLYVAGLRMEEVSTEQEVALVMAKGRQNRSTFATSMNEHSSRSHLVITLYVKGQDLRTGTSGSHVGQFRIYCKGFTQQRVQLMMSCHCMHIGRQAVQMFLIIGILRGNRRAKAYAWYNACCHLHIHNY